MSHAIGQIAREQASNEFSYKPVPMLAPVTLFVGLLSSFALVSFLVLPFCLVGVVLGTICLIRIRRSDGELGGRKLAFTGLGLSLLFLVSGSAYQTYAYTTEVPEGYERISFTKDISRKGFIYEDGVPRVHDDVKKLDGRKVFFKGYMYPTRQISGIDAFVLVKDNQQCCFGGNPAVTDMVLVKVPEDKTVDYYPGLVSVAGVFHAEKPEQSGGLTPVYQLDGEFFSIAKTTY